MSSRSNPHAWTTCDPQSATHLRLFCFPYAGGGSATFHSWPHFLPAGVEVCAVRLPGRESRLNEPPYDQILPLVEKLREVLIPFLNQPFAFFGHSMGALISFELARQLRREGNALPQHLFLSGYPAPQLPPLSPEIHQLPRNEFILELRRTYGTFEKILNNAELIELFLPLLRADFAVCETYLYLQEDPLPCSISVFGGLQDRKVKRDELSAWASQTRGSFSLCMLPGKHLFLETAGTLLLQRLGQSLTEILSQTV
jgi:medium-chain acyl-[acyl-carrier-protein] hydrolase